MNKQSNLNRAGAKVILWFLILGMLGFTVTRTLHFLQLTFPLDQQYVAYLALVAFDVGVLGWLYYATHAAEGTTQRVVGYGMIFVCAAGVIVTTIADMLMVSAKNGVTDKLPPDVATAALWAVMLVITLNVLAGILVHLFDPKHQKHMAVESAKDKIHASVHEAIAKRAGDIAPRIAEHVAAHWENQIVDEMTGSIPSSKPRSSSSRTTGDLSDLFAQMDGQMPSGDLLEAPDGDIYGAKEKGKSKVDFKSGGGT
jgi:hypothetical protein